MWVNSCICHLVQVERVVTIMQNPRQYKIPDWFLNRQKDVKDGKYSQVGEQSTDSDPVVENHPETMVRLKRLNLYEHESEWLT